MFPRRNRLLAIENEFLEVGEKEKPLLEKRLLNSSKN
jgi:hypothetical protein